jgi:hypothetical protein
MGDKRQIVESKEPKEVLVDTASREEKTESQDTIKPEDNEI